MSELTPHDLDKYRDLAERLVVNERAGVLKTEEVQAAALALHALIEEVHRLHSARVESTDSAIVPGSE